MEGQQRALVLLGGFTSGQQLQLFAIAAIVGTKDVRTDVISSSRKDLSYIGTKSSSIGSCCVHLEATQKA